MSEPFFENRNSVVAPERLPIEDEERHAEDVVRSGLGLRLVVSDGAGVAQVIAVGVGGHAEIFDQRGDRVGLVGFEFAAKEQLEGLAAIVEQAFLHVCEEAADECRPRILNFQRPANQEASRVTHLTDAQIADVVNYVRSHFENKYKTNVTAGQVAALPHPAAELIGPQ